MKDDIIKNASAAKVPSMFWLAGIVTVEQKDAVNNALNFKKVLFIRESYTKVIIKEKLKFANHYRYLLPRY